LDTPSAALDKILPHLSRVKRMRIKLSNFKEVIMSLGLVLITVITILHLQKRPAWAKAEVPLETALVAGGCFWCLQAPFEALSGVKQVTVGYTGGRTAHPTYEDVSLGKTGHYEAVKIEFDPRKISYEKILEKFWHQIDPMDAGGQFADRGSQYRTAIFYRNARQKWEAELSRQAVAESGRFSRPIATEIKAASFFYPAEAFHQGYYRSCRMNYESYREHSGRDTFIRKNWAAKHDARPVNGKHPGFTPKKVEQGGLGKYKKWFEGQAPTAEIHLFSWLGRWSDKSRKQP
jgi:methionine-S-sulfoxide reductase